MEGDALGVADLATGGEHGKGREAFEHRVGQLVARELEDDLLERLRCDVARLGLVEVTERLSQALALETLHQLREFAEVACVSHGALGVRVGGRTCSPGRASQRLCRGRA